MNEECQIVVVIPIALVTGSLLFSVEVWPVSWSSMHARIYPYVVFYLSVLFVY